MTRLAALLLILALAPLPANAQDLESRVVEHTLKNGMRFLFVERHQAPVFSGVIIVKVGGVDEPNGRTGIAHMFEHMAFKGTHHIGIKNAEEEKPLLDQIRTVAAEFTRLRTSIPKRELDNLQTLESQLLKKAGEDASKEDPNLALSLLKATQKDTDKQASPHLATYIQMQTRQKELKALQEKHKQLVVTNEFWQTLLANGGTGMNAGTAKDYTIYYESLPANRLELWAMMESERLRDTVMREFYIERDVVAEERRGRTETNPNGKLREALVTTAFQAHPYGLPNIGWMSDINSFTFEDADAFRKTYYVANNMVGVLVGDFHTPDAIQIVNRYFEKLPSGPPPPEIRTQEPEQTGERRTIVEFDAEPQVLIAFHKPTAPHQDDYVFDLLDNLLSEGRSSRLYTRLVKQDRIASDVSTYGAPGSRYDNLFVISAQPIPPHTTQELETAIYEELDRLKTEPRGRT